MHPGKSLGERLNQKPGDTFCSNLQNWDKFTEKEKFHEENTPDQDFHQERDKKFSTISYY